MGVFSIIYFGGVGLLSESFLVNCEFEGLLVGERASVSQNEHVVFPKQQREVDLSGPSGHCCRRERERERERVSLYCREGSFFRHAPFLSGFRKLLNFRIFFLIFKSTLYLAKNKICYSPA